MEQLVPARRNADNSYTWAVDSDRIDSHTLAIEGSLVLPVFQQGFIQLGGGYRVSWTAYEKGSRGYQGRLVFRIAYAINGL
ncbi:MAG: hypothetical protein N3A02_07590 [Rectinema sp.]|nr:hypothetical protein [Rectinema sp.]